MTEDGDDLNPRRRGLGRGLDALFGDDESNAVSRETDISDDDFDLSPNDIVGDDLRRRTLPIEWLRPCSLQPRKHFDQDALEDLAKSIGMHGILQPLLVRPIEDEDNQYEIIAGERRWRAAQIIQLHEVPVTVQYLDDEAVLEIALIENLQREDLNPIEEAIAMQKLMDDFGHTQENLSVAIGKSRSAIANTLRLLQLPDSVQDMVQRGELSEGHARTLIGQDNALEVAKQIVSDKLSVRAAEQLGHRKKQSSSKPKPEKGVNTIALEEEMERLLGMKVTINAGSKKGHGSVKIDYQSLDQLDELLHRLSKH